MSKNNRDHSISEVKELKQTIQKLKAHIRHLTKENRILKSEIKTALRAWAETNELIHDLTDDIDLEDLLK